MDPVSVRIGILENALVQLASVTDENYPILRQSILVAGEEDFVKGIQISLGEVVVATPVLDENGDPIPDTFTYEQVQQSPYDIEKYVLVAVIKTVLQVSYTTRWLNTPLA